MRWKTANLAVLQRISDTGGIRLHIPSAAISADTKRQSCDETDYKQKCVLRLIFNQNILFDFVQQAKNRKNCNIDVDIDADKEYNADNETGYTVRRRERHEESDHIRYRAESGGVKGNGFQGNE